MARVTASLYMSHVPAIGAAVDKGHHRGAVLEAAVRRHSAGT